MTTDKPVQVLSEEERQLRLALFEGKRLLRRETELLFTTITALREEKERLKEALNSLEEAVDAMAPGFYAAQASPPNEGRPLQQLGRELDQNDTPLGRLETAMKDARTALQETP